MTQYYEKNAPDADSWLEVTGKALSTVTDVLDDMIQQANKGSNKDLGPEDLQIIIEQLKSLKEEFYSTGNVDYAGRYVFTGFRTDTTMSFTKEVESNPPSYKITEQATIGDFDTINYTDIGKLEGLNKNNYDGSNYTGIKEQDVSNGDIHRMRLAYDDLKAGQKVEIEIKDATGTKIPTTEISTGAAQDPYQKILEANANGTAEVVFVPETGEVLFSDKAYADLEATINAADGTKTEIRVTYTKEQWKDGDLRPEHYFACTGTTKDAGGNYKDVDYNMDYLDGKENSQVIEYDVGYNQRIRVNTRADEVFDHNLDRDIDDLEKALKSLTEIAAPKKDLENVLKGMDMMR